MINQLHQTQAIVAQDDHDFRVVDCGRQWGKTTLAVEEMKACGYYKRVHENVPHNEIAYFATTFDQARNIAWAMLKDSTRSAWDRPPNESRLELWLRTKYKELTRITLRGFENIETARGQQFDLLVIDEVAFMRNWRYAWQSILEPTLSFRKGKALFISTPQGFNHFYDLYELGQKEDQFYKSWKFTSYDNPYLSKERIEQAKLTSTPEYFAQEYLADFRRYTGLALTQFEREIHVIEAFDVPSEWKRGRGFDYGSKDPTASLRVAIDNDNNWFVERAYKQAGSTIQEHATTVLAQDYGLGFMPIYGDPSGDQWEKEFKQYGLHILPAVKETGQNAQGYVAFTIETINERLKPIPGHTVNLPNGKVINNAPRLFFLNTPEVMMVVKEAEVLKWKETAQGQVLPILDEYIDPNGHCDLLACLRYFAVSYVKPQPIQYNNDPGGVAPFIPGIG